MKRDFLAEVLFLCTSAPTYNVIIDLFGLL